MYIFTLSGKAKKWLTPPLQSWRPRPVRTDSHTQNHYGHKTRISASLNFISGLLKTGHNRLQALVTAKCRVSRSHSGNVGHTPRDGEYEKDTPSGQVYLIGAGPGDPELLTLRAWRLLQTAEVIVYDRLVSQDILNLCAPTAEYIYVGKRRASHVMQQSEINRTMADHAMLGKSVARLKGGDPFIFGRGGEEMQSLASLGIDCQVVPGITAASACASYAGIPLTHRDYAQSVVFVTGHVKDGFMDLPWPQLVQKNQTIACYMGLKSLPVLSAQLILHGLDPATPAALIENGSMPLQKVTTTTVAELKSAGSQVTPGAPMMLIIGHVVSLHTQSCAKPGAAAETAPEVPPVLPVSRQSNKSVAPREHSTHH